MNQIYEGHSHSFDVGVAKNLGMAAAVVLNHIIYWLKVNASKGTNFYDGKTWMYETQREIAEFLEYLSIEEVKKAIVKLLDSGILIKGNYNSNPFDRTAWYSVCDQNIIRIKKTLTKAPYGAIDNAPGRHPKRPMAPCIYNEQEEQQEEQQQQQEKNKPVVAVLSKIEIFEEIKDIDIPQTQKEEICANNDRLTVKNAVGWATDPANPPTKCLAASIKYACKNKLSRPAIPIENEDKNKMYAEKYDNMQNSTSKILACNSYVEITNCGINGGTTIAYKEKGFIEQFHSALRKNNFKILGNT